VAALGDSITAGSPLWHPDPALRRARGDGVNEQSQYEYWARLRLGPNASFRNCGVFGETTAQIARRLDRCARGAQVLIVQGGINDVYRPIPVERSAANLSAMVRRGRRLGLRVALANVLPWNNGYPRYAAKIARLNALIARVGRDEHVPVLPFFQTLEDPQRPGRMRADWTIDGDHPSVPGYRRLGEVVELP
jgi:lysophospholipase L1-like esterase